MAAASLLLVEDDPDFALGLSRLLERAGYQVQVETGVARALAAAAGGAFAAVLTDLQLPDGDGFDLLAGLAPGTRVICLTGRDDASSALRAIRAGAVDYLTKPVTREALIAAVQAALGSGPSPAAAPVQQVTLEEDTHVGSSPAWRRVLELVAAVAKSPRTTVLITGEPGCGKEIAAGLVHRLSRRAEGPFVTANAACLSPQLIESELFGHEVGAFTGAQKRRRGLFEMAAGGTLFLDEIGELPLDLQGKLLRVLEGQSFRRVGGEQELAPDARFVCATNRDLPRRVREGSFRADLYERLRVFEVHVPSLRERTDDVLALAEHFGRRLAASLGLGPAVLLPEAREALVRHTWPGNVRELRNVIERAMLLADGAPLALAHLPPELSGSGGLAARPSGPLPAREDVRLESVVRTHIEQVYAACGENLTHTSAALGLSRLALRKRLQAYGLKPVASEPALVANGPVAS